MLEAVLSHWRNEMFDKSLEAAQNLRSCGTSMDFAETTLLGPSKLDEGDGTYTTGDNKSVRESQDTGVRQSSDRERSSTGWTNQPDPLRDENPSRRLAFQICQDVTGRLHPSWQSVRLERSQQLDSILFPVPHTLCHEAIGRDSGRGFPELSR